MTLFMDDPKPPDQIGFSHQGHCEQRGLLFNIRSSKFDFSSRIVETCKYASNNELLLKTIEGRYLHKVKEYLRVI